MTTASILKGLMGIYSTPFYFIDAFVSIVTLHMTIYEFFAWQKKKKNAHIVGNNNTKIFLLAS